MTIVTGRKLDYKKHCTMEFGTYVQAHNKNDPSNNNIEQSIDGIYLRPNENIQGGHLIMNLNTGKIISRARVTKIPLPSTVKEKVEQMAPTEGKSDMKFYNRNGLELPNSDDVRGVEYTDAYDDVEVDDDYENNKNEGRPDRIYG